MRAMVGHWCQGLSVELMRQDAQSLLMLSPTWQVEMSGRVLMLSPAVGGSRISCFGERNQPGFTHRLSRIGFDLPHFELFEVELDPQGDGEDYYLAAELPADHDLPWPSKRTITAMARSQPIPQVSAFCEDQVQVRCNSAAASGLPRLPAAIPAYIVQAVTEPCLALRTWSTAKQLAGVS